MHVKEQIRQALRYTLAMFSLGLAVMTPAYALEKSDPTTPNDGSGGWGPVYIGPGPGDRSLDPSGMPPSGDAAERARAERKEKEAERKRTERHGQPTAKPPTIVTSIGKVNTGTPSTTPTHRTICEAARDARARNSPAAPNLEAQCRASRP